MAHGNFEVSRREVNLGLLGGLFALLARPQLGGPAAAVAASRVLFDFAIAGGWHHALSIAADGLKPGEALRLAPEPDNPHDVNAVAVRRGDGLMLGYIPRRANAPVAALLRSGAAVRAIVVEPLDVTSDEGIPDDLVFTGFTDGDPRVRLIVTG